MFGWKKAAKSWEEAAERWKVASEVWQKLFESAVAKLADARFEARRAWAQLDASQSVDTPQPNEDVSVNLTDFMHRHGCYPTVSLYQNDQVVWQASYTGYEMVWGLDDVVQHPRLSLRISP